MTAPATAYLVCYDIAATTAAGRRRLGRVRRRLLGVAQPVQYSVFCGRFTPAQRRSVLAALARRIDPKGDDVRMYPIPANPWFRCLGRPTLPAGIFVPAPLAGSARRNDPGRAGESTPPDAESFFNAPRKGLKDKDFLRGRS